MLWLRVLTAVALLGAPSLDLLAGPTDLFVDGRIGASTCTTYSPATRTCAAGNERAFATIAAASEASRPGDTVWIRAGTYRERLVPRQSGTATASISFRAFSGEAPLITGSSFDPAIDLSNREYIIIDGLTVTDVVGWLRGENTHHTVVRNSTFERATAPGTRAGLKYVKATFNQVLNNTIHDGNDNVMFVHSDRNVMEGNTVSKGRHALWAILCGSFNVVRNNTFENEIQKIGQVTDCEGVPSDAPPLYDATKHNLIEGNRFGFTPSSGTRSPYAGIQYAAQRGIIRRNVFHGMTGPGIQMTLYDREARFNTDNRVYHNVFHAARHAGLDLAQPGDRFSGNVFVNNILHANRFLGYATSLEGLPVQILAGRLDGYHFSHNNIHGGTVVGHGTVVYGGRNVGMLEGVRDLAWWHENRGALFAGNLDDDPAFVDAGSRDFRLAVGSPMIDRGASLTRTRSAGVGVTLPVEDASYFFDGFGIPGQSGDLLRLQHGEATVRVLRIDRAANTLTLDRTVEWREHEGVSLAYSGTAPDLGATEFEPLASPGANGRFTPR